MSVAFNQEEFRRVMGHYPTGVCAVTSMLDASPVGMIVGSFTSVSLNPPLVGFLPNRRSRSWRKIQQSGHFCVNILGEHQYDVCQSLASRREDKFDDVPYRLSTAGMPIIDHAIAWIDCDLTSVYEVGDHFIAIGLVHSLNAIHSNSPLLFCKGDYGLFTTALEDIRAR